jgi:hypothetical protein
VGDIVSFGEDLQLTDIGLGNRNFRPRLMEVLNKKLNLKTGDVTLDLLSSSLDIQSRYGVISGTSKIGPGATTTKLPLKKSFSTGEFETEVRKWEPYLREIIEVHTVDYSFSEKVRLLGIDTVQPETLVIEPLSIAPPEDYLVDMPKYPEVDPDPQTQRKWKDQHVFSGLEVGIVSGTDDFSFDIPGANVGDFFEGAVVRVHNADFSIDSTPTIDTPDAVITDITGTTITVNRSLGFTPNNTFVVILIGFIDRGFPYRYI